MPPPDRPAPEPVESITPNALALLAFLAPRLTPASLIGALGVGAGFAAAAGFVAAGRFATAVGFARDLDPKRPSTALSAPARAAALPKMPRGVAPAATAGIAFSSDLPAFSGVPKFLFTKRLSDLIGEKLLVGLGLAAGFGGLTVVGGGLKVLPVPS